MKTAALPARVLAAVAAFTFSTYAGAAHNPQHATADGLEIYYGVLPAAMVRGHEKEHSGKPQASRDFHVVVTLFDKATGRRITEAKVAARIAEVGLAGEEKSLEPMKVNEATSFGNYFRMSGPRPHRIELSIWLPGAHRPIQARFEYRQP
jgi:hypothetical protein